MHSERLSLQTLVELKVGCTSIEKWVSYKQQLETLVIGEGFYPDASSAIRGDAASLLHKGLLSLVGAYQDLVANHRSWAIVKLYYSLFYTVRARLCLRLHGLVRNKCWYHFDLNVPSCTGVKLNRRDRYRNDHEAALHLYEDLFVASDPLLSNTVEGTKPFEWMMELRNTANYRLARFPDPGFPSDTLGGITLTGRGSLDQAISDNIGDAGHILLFQPEHAWLALPIKMIISAYGELNVQHHRISLSIEQLQHTNDAIASLPEPLREILQAKAIFDVEKVSGAI